MKRTATANGTGHAALALQASDEPGVGSGTFMGDAATANAVFALTR